VNNELRRVIENILDPNTPAKKKRSVTLKIVFIPDESREQNRVEISCTSVLAAARESATTVWLQEDVQGNIHANESNYRQPNLGFEGEAENVAPMRQGESG
jgi:hypothetical protein